MKQLVLWPEKKYIDKRADGYILAEPFFRDIMAKYVGEKETTLMGLKSGSPEKDEKYLETFSFEFIRAFGKRLNSYHGINFCHEQWIQILYRDVRCTMFMAFYIYKKLEMLNSEDVFSIGRRTYNPVSRVWRAWSWYDVDGNGDANVYIWSFFAQRMGIKIRNAEPTVLFELSRVTAHVYNTIKHRIFEMLKSKNKKAKKIEIDVNKAEILLYKPFITDIDKIVDESDGKIALVDDEEITKMFQQSLRRGNKKLRRKIFSGCFNYKEDSFESIFCEYYIDNFATWLLEGFERNYLSAKRISSFWKARVFLSPYLDNGLISLAVAMARERGLVYYGMQHSGGYNSSLMTVLGELPLCDKYITWGWRYMDNVTESGKIIPVGMNRVPKQTLSGCEHVCTDRILYIASGIWLDHMNEGLYFGDYLNNILFFLSEIKKSIRKGITIRLRGGGYMNNLLADAIQFRYPEVAIENGSYITLEESLSLSKYVIIDHAGSTEFETLLFGKPFLKYNADSILITNETYKNAIDYLKENGIYYDDASELAQVINLHGFDEQWLKSKEKQAAYRKFSADFTSTDLTLQEGAGRDLMLKYRNFLYSLIYH